MTKAMNMQEYQAWTAKMWRSGRDATRPREELEESRQLLMAAVGLTGEAGEAAEVVKKVVRDRGSVFSPDAQQRLAQELGDVLYYLATLARICGISLQEIINANVAKLELRLAEGTLAGANTGR